MRHLTKVATPSFWISCWGSLFETSLGSTGSAAFSDHAAEVAEGSSEAHVGRIRPVFVENAIGYLLNFSVKF